MRNCAGSFTGFESNVFEGVGGNAFEGMSGNVFEGHRGFNDLFGFGQIAPAPAGYILDPYYEANKKLTADAKAALAAFNQNVSKIPTLPLETQRADANAILSKNWYGKGILGLTGLNLKQLAPDIQTYANEGVFHQYVPKVGGDAYYSDTRVKKLKAFSDGSRELYRFMKQFLPTQVIERLVSTTQEVGLSASELYAKAEASAITARKNQVLADAAAARAFAIAAIDAAQIEGHEGIEASAKLIADEMNELIKKLGAPVAPVKISELPGWVLPVVLGVGGVAVVATIVVLATRK